MKGQYPNFFIPDCLYPCLLQPQTLSCAFLLEQPIQLAAQSRHGDFSFQREFAHFPNLHLFYLLDKVPSTLASGSLPRTCFPVAGPHVGAKPWVYHTCWCLMLATAGCRLLMKTVGVLAGCDCGGKVIVLEVDRS